MTMTCFADLKMFLACQILVISLVCGGLFYYKVGAVGMAFCGWFVTTIFQVALFYRPKREGQ